METLAPTKWEVLSPDGFAIHPTDTYDTPEAAIAARDQWVKRYEQQGYYSSPKYGKIELEILANCCDIVPAGQEDSGDDFHIAAF